MNLPGRLRMTTLGDLLGTLHRAEATGTLEFAEDGGRTHRVYMSAGFVVSVEIDGATPTLSEILRRDHGIGEDLLRRSLLRAMSSHRLHGDVLVQDFQIDGTVVGEALRRQILARLERLDRLTDARVLFRVAIRTPRGALTDAPPPASQFLGGRKRARDATRQSTSAPPPRESSARVCSPHRSREVALRVLGVSPEAEPTEIRRAYRRLARAFHPDLHPAASEDERRALVERFQVVTEAYRALVA
jgi:DnaJ-domain-containing protein 1